MESITAHFSTFSPNGFLTIHYGATSALTTKHIKKRGNKLVVKRKWYSKEKTLPIDEITHITINVKEGKL